jgi:hypothetical protein
VLELYVERLKPFLHRKIDNVLFVRRVKYFGGGFDKRMARRAHQETTEACFVGTVLITVSTMIQMTVGFSARSEKYGPTKEGYEHGAVCFVS